MGKSLSQLKFDLEALKNVRMAPEVIEAANKVLEKRKPEIEALEKQIEEMRSKRPAKAPRWPANIPADVMKACEDYWSGTTEFATFRVHMWNSKAVWMSYPSGGYSNNGGWHPTPASFQLMSLLNRKSSMGRLEGAMLSELTGRISKAQMVRIMLDKTKEKPHDIG